MRREPSPHSRKGTRTPRPQIAFLACKAATRAVESGDITKVRSVFYGAAKRARDRRGMTAEDTRHLLPALVANLGVMLRRVLQDCAQLALRSIWDVPVLHKFKEFGVVLAATARIVIGRRVSAADDDIDQQTATKEANRALEYESSDDSAAKQAKYGDRYRPRTALEGLQELEKRAKTPDERGAFESVRLAVLALLSSERVRLKKELATTESKIEAANAEEDEIAEDDLNADANAAPGGDDDEWEGDAPGSKAAKSKSKSNKRASASASTSTTDTPPETATKSKRSKQASKHAKDSAASTSAAASRSDPAHTTPSTDTQPALVLSTAASAPISSPDPVLTSTIETQPGPDASATAAPPDPSTSTTQLDLRSAVWKRLGFDAVPASADREIQAKPLAFVAILRARKELRGKCRTFPLPNSRNLAERHVHLGIRDVVAAAFQVKHEGKQSQLPERLRDVVAAADDVDDAQKRAIANIFHREGTEGEKREHERGRDSHRIALTRLRTSSQRSCARRSSSTSTRSAMSCRCRRASAKRKFRVSRSTAHVRTLPPTRARTATFVARACALSKEPIAKATTSGSSERWSSCRPWSLEGARAAARRRTSIGCRGILSRRRRRVRTARPRSDSRSLTPRSRRTSRCRCTSISRTSGSATKYGTRRAMIARAATLTKCGTASRSRGIGTGARRARTATTACIRAPRPFSSSTATSRSNSSSSLSGAAYVRTRASRRCSASSRSSRATSVRA